MLGPYLYIYLFADYKYVFFLCFNILPKRERSILYKKLQLLNKPVFYFIID